MVHVRPVDGRYTRTFITNWVKSSCEEIDVDLRVPNDEMPLVRRMREIRTSGGMRGEGSIRSLLYSTVLCVFNFFRNATLA